MGTDITKFQQEINTELAKKEVFNALVATTFDALYQRHDGVQLIKRAMLEGMMMGFTFEDFLKKNVYAVPFKNSYTLITSIDLARKIGMRSGICGKSAPIYEDDENGRVKSCTVTVKRKIDEHVGEYTATVYFSEYDTGKNLWVSKPRTMIAKVAEMHALRMACPEELAKNYIIEEMDQSIPHQEYKPVADDSNDKSKEQVDVNDQITDKQYTFIQSLAQKKLGKKIDEASLKISKEDAKKLIDKLLKMPAKGDQKNDNQ